MFTAIRKMGRNAAVTGYGVPYCVMFGSSLTECYWEPNVDVVPAALAQAFAEQAGIGRAMLLGVEDALRVSFLKLGSEAYERRMTAFVRKNQLAAYQRTQQQALALVKNPQLGFVFLHWLIPHRYGIYDREKNDFSLAERTNYVDNLELVDRTIGELRQALEDSGQWDRTAVLITSDHPLRTFLWLQDWRKDKEMIAVSQKKEYPLVPFLLKLPGQNEGLTYELPFSGVLAHHLVLALLQRQLTTPKTGSPAGMD